MKPSFSLDFSVNESTWDRAVRLCSKVKKHCTDKFTRSVTWIKVKGPRGLFAAFRSRRSEHPQQSS